MAEKLTIEVIAKVLGIKSLNDLKAGMDMIKDVINKTREVITSMTDAYGKQEIEEAKLQKVVGGSIKSLTDFASQMQKVTTVGDEDSLSIMRLATSMGVAKDQLPLVTKNAISLSKALNMDLGAATKIASAALQGNYDLLARYSPQLKTAKSDTEKMAIVQELMSKGWKMTEAEANTYAGTQERINNIQGDMLETGGKLIATIGKDMSKAYLETITSINEAIAKEENFNTIALTVKKTIEILSGSLTFIKDGFKNLRGSTTDNNKEFDLFGGTLKTVATAFVIIAAVMNTLIKGTMDFIKVNIMAGKAVGDLWTMLFGSKEAKEKAKANLDAMGADLVSMGKSYIDITKKTIDDTKAIWSGLKDIKEDNKKNNKEIIQDTNDTFDNMIEITGTGTDKMKEIFEAEMEKMKKAYEQKQKDFISSTSVMISSMGEIFDNGFMPMGSSIAKLADNMASSFSNMYSTWIDKNSTASEKIISSVKGIGSAISGALELARQAVDGYYSNEIEQIKNANQEEISDLDEKYKNELSMEEEKQKYDGMTREQALQDLKDKLAASTDASEQAKLQDKITTIENEKAKESIINSAEEAKKKTQEKYAKKEAELKLQQFRLSQGLAVAQVWIQAGIASMAGWASAMQLSFPANVIVGAILTATAATMAGVQTGLILSQAPPTFVTGGIMGNSGMALVGEHGAELVNLPAGSRISNASQTSDILSGMNGGDTYYISVGEIRANNVYELKEQLLELVRQEKGRA